MCFLLRLCEGNERLLIERGAVGVEDAPVIRPRDQMVLKELAGVL